MYIQSNLLSNMLQFKSTSHSLLLTNTAAGLWVYISLRKLRLGQAVRESFKMQGTKAKCKFKQNSRESFIMRLYFIDIYEEMQ